MDPVYDNFSMMPNGFRDFIVRKADEFGCTGFVRRHRTNHVEIQVEGREEDFLQLDGLLRELMADRVIGSVTFTQFKTPISVRFFPNMSVVKNSSVTCHKGTHSPDGWETSSHPSDADREVPPMHAL